MTYTFGQRLRQIRQQQTMSQRDLAARACIEVSYLAKIEQGYCPPPSAATITALACALGTDRDELFALGGKIPSDIVQLLIRRPLLVQLVRLGAQWNEDQVRLVLRQNGVPEPKLHFPSIAKGSAEIEDQLRVRREPIRRGLRTAVFRRDNYECVYCSASSVLEVDHVYPESFGGTNEIENLVTCCDRCNKKKKDRQQPPPMVFGRFRESVQS